MKLGQKSRRLDGCTLCMQTRRRLAVHADLRELAAYAHSDVHPLRYNNVGVDERLDVLHEKGTMGV